MPLPALLQPYKAEDPNRATFVLSILGLFPHLSQGSPEVLFYMLERIGHVWRNRKAFSTFCKEAKDMGYALEVGLKLRTVEAEKYPHSR